MQQDTLWNENINYQNRLWNSKFYLLYKKAYLISISQKFNKYYNKKK